MSIGNGVESSDLSNVSGDSVAVLDVVAELSESINVAKRGSNAESSKPKLDLEQPSLAGNGAQVDVDNPKASDNLLQVDDNAFSPTRSIPSLATVDCNN
ncbi:hypothetical protein AAC387_Pa01g1984 [Persea americana]